MPRLTAEDWVLGAFRALLAGGPGAIRVEPLARTLGVSKDSFYWHFANRQALIDATFATWAQNATERTIERLGADDVDPGRRLRRLMHEAMGDEGEFEGVEAELRGWAGSDAAAAAAVATVDARRLAYIARLLRGAGQAPWQANQRAGIAYRAFIGEHIWRRQGAARMSAAEVDAFTDMLLR